MKKTRKKKVRKQAHSVIEVPRSLEELHKDGLLGMVVEAGFETLAVHLEQERARICGPRYAHQEARQVYRHGHAPGELILGGRRVQVPRPRARTVHGQEVSLPSWETFSAEDPLQSRAVEQMVVGVATRKYHRSLEPIGDAQLRGTSKSAVSRRFVAATAAQLTEWMRRDISELDLVALMMDGVHFAEHMVLVALGIDTQGRKHVLGLWEGATENAGACKALLRNLIGRGLRTDRCLLAVIDGSKALVKALRQVFGRYVLIQRCQEHKKRNVTDHLPKGMHRSVRLAMQGAYRARDVERAKRLLLNLARRIEAEHPGAAASLREGLDETLTVIAFRLPLNLERTLATTNPIENVLGTARYISRRVKRWRGGHMILRWMYAGVKEAERGFRRLKGYRSIPKLVAALRQHDARISPTLDRNEKAA